MSAYTSLDAFKAYLGIKAGSQASDELLQQLLDGACAAAESWLGGSLLAADHDECYSGNGSNRLVLRHWPVQRVAAVTINGQSVPQQAQAGAQSGAYGWRHIDWLLVLDGGVFARGTCNVRVQYRAGLDAIPADVAGAIHQIAALRYRERDWTGYASKSLAGEVISFHSHAPSAGQSVAAGGIPPAALAVLNRYRRVVPT